MTQNVGWSLNSVDQILMALVAWCHPVGELVLNPQHQAEKVFLEIVIRRWGCFRMGLLKLPN